MQRGSESIGGGGLGPQLVGEKISVNRRAVSVLRQLGEGKLSSWSSSSETLVYQADLLHCPVWLFRSGKRAPPDLKTKHCCLL
jgi:hypothetical protein